MLPVVEGEDQRDEVGWVGRVKAAYFSDTAASKSAKLLSILKRSLRARENERAIVLLCRELLACMLS